MAATPATRIADEYSGQSARRQGVETPIRAARRCLGPRRTCDVPPVGSHPWSASCFDGLLACRAAADATLSGPSALAAASGCLEPCRARAGLRACRVGHAREVRDGDPGVTPAGESGLRRPLPRSQQPAGQTRGSVRAQAANAVGAGDPDAVLGNSPRRRERGGIRKRERLAEHAADRAAEHAADGAAPSHPRD